MQRRPLLDQALLGLVRVGRARTVEDEARERLEALVDELCKRAQSKDSQ